MMTNSDRRVAEIRARHDAATTGPWVFATDKGAPEYVQLYSIAEIDEYEADILSGEDGAELLINEPNAELIAESWADIGWLLAEVERQRQELVDAWTEIAWLQTQTKLCPIPDRDGVRCDRWVTQEGRCELHQGHPL